MGRTIESISKSEELRKHILGGIEMIFVTVGTHEQQFNRLVKKVDELKRDGVIEDEVFIQTGYSTYEPEYCRWKKLISYSEMDQMYKEADIIITHGGPASFMKALELKKIPIVVPRQEKFEEHVNDHQVEFVEFVEERQKSIIGVYEIENLEKELKKNQSSNRETIKNTKSNNENFNKKLIDSLQNIEG